MHFGEAGFGSAGDDSWSTGRTGGGRVVYELFEDVELSDDVEDDDFDFDSPEPLLALVDELDESPPDEVELEELDDVSEDDEPPRLSFL